MFGSKIKTLGDLSILHSPDPNPRRVLWVLVPRESNLPTTMKQPRFALISASFKLLANTQKNRFVAIDYRKRSEVGYDIRKAR